MSDFKPTEEQCQATKAIYDWYRDDDAYPVFYLAGYAGSGKTSLTPYAIEQLGLDIDDRFDTLFGAYTGKASLVMRRRGLQNATTIHQMIYKPYEDEKTGKVKFSLNKESEVLGTKLVVLDECSMIDDKLAEDLMSFKKKILVLGDPGQLRPINGEGFFTRRQPNFFLRTIHRQAENNPIIKLSMMARDRQEIPLGDYGEDVRVIDTNSKSFNFEDLLNIEQIITGKNDTRCHLNVAIKDAMGFTDSLPIKPGIRMVCLRNQHDLGLLNGTICWSVGDECYQSQNGKFFTQSVIDEEKNLYEDLEISTGSFIDYHRKRTEKEKIEERKSRNLSWFDFAFAMTCHKSQGSQWDEVLIWDDGFGRWDRSIRSEWVYTGLTRASKKLTILRAW